MKKLTDKQIKTIDTKISIGTDSYIVLVDTMGDRTIVGDECNNNIYCINSNYEIIWQVQIDKSNFDDDPFTYLGFSSNNILKANKFRGNEYIIDKDTGKAVYVGWSK